MLAECQYMNMIDWSKGKNWRGSKIPLGSANFQMLHWNEISRKSGKHKKKLKNQFQNLEWHNKSSYRERVYKYITLSLRTKNIWEDIHFQTVRLLIFEDLIS